MNNARLRTLLSFILMFACIASMHAQIDSISGVINTYTRVNGIDDCNRQVSVHSATGFSVGDRVLIIQMKGAKINTLDSSVFGTILDYGNTGNYEFATITDIQSNTITLNKYLLRVYDAAYVQMVRVPTYTNVVVSGVLTSAPWNAVTGTGGVLVFEASGWVKLNANIDVTGKGFRGGAISLDGTMTNITGYIYPASDAKAGYKGEGIAVSQTQYETGRGAIASGGGGGNAHNAGGGGGGNFGSGGIGGKQGSVLGPMAIGGLGGRALSYSNPVNKIFLGGGGGGGHANDDIGTAGCNGGGIVIIRADSLNGNTNKIISNGESPSGIAGQDGAGGGGAGGTILFHCRAYGSTLTAEAKGGKGGNNNSDNASTIALDCNAPGGGGGGGVVWLSAGSVPSGMTIAINGGPAGQTVNSLTDPPEPDTAYCDSSSTYGAADGTLGDTLFNLILPEGTNPIGHLMLPGDSSPQRYNPGLVCSPAISRCVAIFPLRSPVKELGSRFRDLRKSRVQWDQQWIAHSHFRST